jgi:NADH:ubiquinone oxidoreductase subunit
MLFNKGRLVGKDENGNSYYESSTGKRCVVYNKISDPTTVPSYWHIWLHYSDDALPIPSKKHYIKFSSNATKNKSYYKSWNPDN